MKKTLTLSLLGWLLLGSLFSQHFYKSTKLFASDRALGDNLGSTVAIDGNYAIAGASLQDTDASGMNTLSQAGAAYIYERDMNGQWQQVQKIVPSNRLSNDRFGFTVDIEGDIAIV